MSKREDDIDWPKLANASHKPKRLHLEDEKKMIAMACFTVQFKPAITMDLTHKEASENT